MKYFYLLLSLVVISCQKEITTNQLVSSKIDSHKSTSPPTDSTKSTGEFKGYVVDKNNRQIGPDYWKNNSVLPDLITVTFQTPLGNRKRYGTFLLSLTTGDFNNDGYIDVFNGGTAYQGQQGSSTFLIWDTTTKKFEDKNLFNDGTTSLGNPGKVMSVYFNNDDYVDILIFGHVDEGISNASSEPMSIGLSDGKGKYNLIKINNLIPDNLLRFAIEGGDLGDLNGDNIMDLFITSNSHTFIFWGIREEPYFTNKNYAHFAHDTTNFKSDNGFGEVVPEGAEVYGAKICDINNDGLNDIILNSPETRGSTKRILINQGKGRFNQNGVIKLPLYDGVGGIGIGLQDCVIDDLNNDGLKDIIGLMNLSGQSWNIITYIQQENGTFIIDKSYFQVDNSTYKRSPANLVYYDFNGDGKKDITYGDDADNGQIIYKSVFIRSDNKFTQKSFYEYDSYANIIKK
jgi:hypothetical protein